MDFYINKPKKENAITLVALVVTIVVLLILAGITIMYLIGDNSVFKKAWEAKEETEKAKVMEKFDLANSDAFIQRKEKGGLTPEEYFAILEKNGIITDSTIDGENVKFIEEREGIKHYDVTTDDGHIVEVTIYPDGRIETEYAGKEEAGLPKIRGIRIMETTQTSFRIKVSARLEGGEILCYYKLKANVSSNEAENDITGYTPITLDSNLEGSVTSGLTAGTTYKIKVVIKKDGEEKGWASKDVTTIVLVANIILDQTTAKVDVDKSITLSATIEPENAENKEMEWTSNKPEIATVEQNGKVTGVAPGEAIIKAMAKDGSGVVASCTVDVELPVSNWEKIAEVAKTIAEDSTINNRTTEVTKGGMTIKVGQIFAVKYSGVLKRVRVIGFNHDTLQAPQSAYGENTTATKAGITFEFIDPIADAMRMNPTEPKYVEWHMSEMYDFLWGKTGYGFKAINETCQNNIKMVKKLEEYKTEPVGINPVSAKLWLLSASEIWSTPTLKMEGEQYALFHEHEESGQGINDLITKTYNGANREWWLRSLGAQKTGEHRYFTVKGEGISYTEPGQYANFVFPAFCI